MISVPPRNRARRTDGRIFRDLDFPGRAAAIQRFRPVPVRNRRPVTAPAFNADDPDTTTADIVQQRRKTRRGFVEETQVQDDRFSCEEAARAGNLVVETFQPEGEGGLWRQDERQEGAAARTDAHGGV